MLPLLPYYYILQILMLGQYSTGKTTFIQYLLERDFPGIRIGPEPTTDRFMAIMHGTEERTTPGHAVAIQADKPFTALSRFGSAFLSKFEVAELDSPILRKMSIIDTPGVLAGAKQRIGRAYDFPTIIEWFAAKADRILLLFDAHKLDISDEFKAAIEMLKGHDDKIRCVLNKADKVNQSSLMRVYGALMWSLGKVIQTPEVLRVYIGSFWDQPYQHTDMAKLFEKEEADLFTDLRSIPRNAVVRKINELLKRVRLCKVHAYLIGYIRGQMPRMMGKEKKQAALLAQIADGSLFWEVQRRYTLNQGDFPQIAKFARKAEVRWALLASLCHCPSVSPSPFSSLAHLLHLLLLLLLLPFALADVQVLEGFPAARRSEAEQVGRCPRLKATYPHAPAPGDVVRARCGEGGGR